MRTPKGSNAFSIAPIIAAIAEIVPPPKHPQRRLDFVVLEVLDGLAGHGATRSTSARIVHASRSVVPMEKLSFNFTA